MPVNICLQNGTIEDHVILDMLGNGTKTMVNMLHQKDSMAMLVH